MAEIVNLRSKRKEAARKAASDQAAENAVKFGRTKAQATLEAAEAARIKAEFDRKKLDGEGRA